MFVTVNGVRLFFDVVGEKLRIGADDALQERPVMIMLHGGPGGDHQSLRPAFDRFAERAQLIYLDQRGGGHSAHGPESGWTLNQWADDVAGLCDALGVTKPIVLGVSGGAMVTASYLARHPGHAGAAILVNACARLDMDAMVNGFTALAGPEAGAAAKAMYSRGDMADFPAFLQHCLPLYSRRGSTGAPRMDARQTFNFAVSQRFFSGSGDAFNFDFRAKLGKVSCPVLALAGAHDPVTRPEWGRELAEALPAGVGEFVLFEESSHVISADEPDKFYASVERFLDRVQS